MKSYTRIIKATSSLTQKRRGQIFFPCMGIGKKLLLMYLLINIRIHEMYIRAQTCSVLQLAGVGIHRIAAGNEKDKWMRGKYRES